jgi:glutamyl-tRNA synthetase
MVRVRYAPSPTGLQHIGGVRTALFNYFFARSQGGKFILRIEDTDQGRYNEESLEDLYDTLNWLGIQWDEGPDKDGGFGPYIQSQRFDLYQTKAKELLDKGLAYRCFCTTERLDQLRKQQKSEKKDFGYDKKCRDLDPLESQKRCDAGESWVLRLKIPEQGKITFTDEILGEISRKTKDVSPDPVILKADGFPTYHLAHVVDDHLMEITHVLRAQEWIPSTPLHVLLFQAFGWEVPRYCHLPMVMGKDGSKLSKRHGSTSVRDFRLGGYLPEAMINYVSLLGWAYDDSREFFSCKDLEELFTLKKLNKSPAVFDYRKLEWFNGQYIRKMDPDKLKELLIPILQEDEIIHQPATEKDLEIFEGAFPLIRERLKYLKDVSEMLRFLFKDIEGYDISLAIPKKMTQEDCLQVVLQLKPLLAQFKDKNQEEMEELFHSTAEERGWKLGQLMQPLRLAVTGSKVSPPLFESITLLGLDKSLERLDYLEKHLTKA